MEKPLNGSQELIHWNYERLIGSIATHYSKKSKCFTQEDLFQYGIIGLIEANKRFDPNRGIDFSTYATYWIKKEILEALKDLDYIIRKSYKKDLNIIEFIEIEDINFKNSTDENDLLYSLLNKLNVKEKNFIIDCYFGKSKEELSKKFNFSSIYINQYKNKIIKKLKRYAQRNTFK